ncbi:MAG: hypothetical protein GXO92_05110 [FCB group bacterium]|nr:hypothetical protein [FCB group bacterium]
MKRFSVLLLLLLLGFAINSDLQKRYYLSEYDFLSDRSVSASEVRGRPHIIAEYNDRDQLISKTKRDSTGNIVTLERFSYNDSTQDLQVKWIYDGNNRLLQKTIFGPEEKSHEYIEYVYGVDTVQSWGDRFTTVLFREDGQPYLYEFYDVDSYQYGNVGFMYDSLGHLSAQLWIKLPSRRIVRRWEYEFDPTTEVNRIMEYDSNGVLVSDTKLSTDGTEAIFWFIAPPDSTYINHTIISYLLEGDLEYGTLTWKSADGGGTAVDSQRFELTGDLLRMGEHRDVNLNMVAALRDSSEYDLVFRGKSTKGYPVTERRIRRLRFDLSPPVLQLDVAQFIREPEFMFRASEPLATATLTWAPDSASPVPGKTVSVRFTPEDLKMSGQGKFRLADQPALIDGVVYRVSIQGTDPTGNVSEPVVVPGVRYDVSPPELAIIAPQNNAHINQPSIVISSDEDLAEGTIWFESAGGAEDIYSPHVIPLENDWLGRGEHQIDLSPQLDLTDGAIYRIKFVGTDQAGNVADTVYVESVVYDVTPPLLTMIFPINDAAIKDATVSFVFNEPLAAAEFRWEWISGTPDSLAPHIVPLEGEELQPGEKIHIELKNQPVLTDGTVYSIYFVGEDLAGNESQPITIENVLFDAVPPAFSEISPAAGEAVNHTNISYRLSENLDEGYVTWIRTGGEPDPDAPHRVPLVESELEGGMHESITLSNMPYLQDGSIYRITFEGFDHAGNTAEPVTVENVLYDISPPKITVEYPRSFLFLPDRNIAYSLSEDLAEGSITWRSTGGLPDTLSPHVIRLDAEQRAAGNHSFELSADRLPILEGTTYSLTITGKDRADNQAPTVDIVGVNYDFTPPSVELSAPTGQSAVNHKRITYSLSENLARGAVTWQWIKGAVDPNPTHSQELVGEELAAGEHVAVDLTNTPALVDGAYYTISLDGEDFAGHVSNRATVENVYYDITNPVFTVTSPQSFAYIASPAVTYSLSETITDGTISFTRTAGSPDPGSPHIVLLAENERQQGPHEDVFLTDGPALVEGGVYTIRFGGRDRAGNEAQTVEIQGVIYDAIPPVLTLTLPVDGDVINNTLVSYSNSELLSSAQFVWTRTGGSPDTASPHIVPLAGFELGRGEFLRAVLENSPRLVDGSLYQIQYYGRDPAGNTSDTVVVSNVLYDVTPPTVLITEPENEAYTATPEVVYTVSEDLARGVITWQGISPTGKMPKIEYQMSGAALQAGEHRVTDYFRPDLVDGGLYTIIMEGADFAGNTSLPSRVAGIHFDITAPAFSDPYPADSSYINTAKIGYTLSENLKSGFAEFIATPDGGGGPRVSRVELNETERSRGKHGPGLLSGQPDLLDGWEYKVLLYGEDLAGNRSDTLTIKGLVYDVTVPEIEILGLQTGAFIRSKDISVRLSEPLTSAIVFWIAESGERISYPVRNEDLAAGEHLLVDYPADLRENVLYTLRITGEDRAGNVSDSETITRIRYDGSPPVITIQFPPENSVVNHSRLSYELSEELASGTVTWEAVDGTDPLSPHTAELTEEERTAGLHEQITLRQNPVLVDSVSYRISIKGVDYAGNESEVVFVEPVLYDVSPPLFTDLSPADDASINELVLGYQLSEDLTEGKITFRQVAGEVDPESPHVINLAGSRLKAGPGGGVLPKSLVKLVNGSVYEITFWGKDRAGNESPPTSVTNLRFDDEPPRLIVTYPTSDSYLNAVSFSYAVSEDLAQATITFENTGGETDARSPLVIELTEKERKAGEFTDVTPENYRELTDGAQYTIRFNGVDFAGNRAAEVVIRNVTYDVSKPVIEVRYPVNGREINAPLFSLTISEDLAEGTLVVTRIDGAVDPRSPQTIALTGEELKAGRKDSLRLAKGPELNNGTIYEFEFRGKDFAGNQAEPVKISGVTFDNEPPVYSITMPIDGEQIKTTQINYLLSDDLAWGAVIFAQTGGTTDPRSPHRVELTGKDLTQGNHMNLELNIADELADGGRYSIKIEGADKAGNLAQGVAVENVLFDVLPPVLTIIRPETGDYINRVTISYSTNEGLSEGTLTFTRTGGAEDPASPHIAELSKPARTQGTHEEIVFNDLNLNDGSVYSVRLDATDLAGNKADPVSVTEIHYDVMPPQFVVTKPQPGLHTREMILDYSVNEQLARGIVEITRREGTFDPESPHQIELSGDQVRPGDHAGLNLSQLTVLKSGTKYTLSIRGEDLAGNQSKPLFVEEVVIDTDPPVLTLDKPVALSYVNDKKLSFSVDEVLNALTIQWTWVSGTPDPQSPHSIELPASYYRPGRYQDVELPAPPDLASSAVYDLHLTGTDLAGNTSTVSVTGVHFDNVAPQITGRYPTTGMSISQAQVSYELSEPVLSGKLIWTATGGTTDPASPHYVELQETELEAGLFATAGVRNQTALKDGAIYSVSMEVTDLAGNKTAVVLAENVRFDVTPPVFSNIIPAVSSFTNSTVIKYALSEDTREGTITWIENGDMDPNAPHEIQLPPELLTKGYHETSSLPDPQLVSGGLYTIQLQAVDQAGNTSRIYKVSNIVYDTTPPEINILYPPAGMYVNQPVVTIKASEPLRSGTVTFIRQGGEPDSRRSHKYLLQGKELRPIGPDGVTISRHTKLMDGTIYRIEFSAVDRAGNTAETVGVDSIYYDVSPPVFTVSKPLPNQVAIGPAVSYVLSEDIVAGSVSWIREGGLPDPKSPRIIELAPEEMKQGEYRDHTLRNQPELSVGAIYTLAFQGIDKAGNESQPTRVRGVEMVRLLDGNWYFKGAIMTVAWSFESAPESGGTYGTFAQGVQLGTKISNQEFGTFKLDYSQKPWVIEWELESGQKRISLFEFQDNNHIKVITGAKKPKNWSDGEIMIYEFR